MKTFIGLMLLMTISAQAEIVGGPRGGKLLDGTSPRVEFFVNAERLVEVAFYDDNLNPVPAGGQSVKIIAEAPGGKVVLETVKSGDLLTSTAPLPEGDGYQIIVQIKEMADGKPRNFRIMYHPEICGGCQRAEYACTCDHAQEGDHGHKH